MEKEIITVICDYLKEELPQFNIVTINFGTLEKPKKPIFYIVIRKTYQHEVILEIINECIIKASSYYNNSGYSPAGCFEICDPDLLLKIKDMIIKT